MCVNMAIPVESAQQPDVIKLYDQVLKEAWGLADQIAGYPELHWKEFRSMRNKSRKTDRALSEACNIYP